MNYNLKILQLLLVILIINAAGFLLRYFELDTFVVFLGFRFHLSLLLPLFIVLRKDMIGEIKKILFTPSFKKLLVPFLLCFIPPAFLIGILFLLKKITYSEPDYFYEFGLSSIVDFPVYFFWNLLQLLCFLLFMHFVKSMHKKKFLLLFMVLLFLIAFEFIPFYKDEFSYSLFAAVVLFFIYAALIIKFVQNVYVESFMIFIPIWIIVLLFGSSSSKIIGIFLAKNYDRWQGFFNVNKPFDEFIYPVYIFLLLVTFISFIPYFKRNTIKEF
ncbi:MAG: hypothetical protein HXY49_08470 [Ignavibacteriaceae bacterium]|nr:hypothetical protein [Ignavibacteriaceae bacterium]